ncbi:MAG: hypothetical protein E7A23_14980, partial [Enterobacter sp.]|nr:hypothetical protein [Enterobacter sp.]
SRPLCPYQGVGCVLTCPFLPQKVDLIGQNKTMNAITNRSGTPCSRISKFLCSPQASKKP